MYLTADARDEAKAVDLLVSLHERTTKDNRFAKTAARLLLDRGETARAKELAYQAVQIAPYDKAAQELFARNRDGGRRRGVGGEATAAVGRVGGDVIH